MAKPPADQPKSLPNDARPVYLKHLAIHILDKEEEDRLKARKKGNETRAKDDGIDVKKMKDRLKLIKTKSPSEIAKMFSEDLQAYSYHDIDLSSQPGAQFNMFGGADAPKKPKGPDFFNVGQLAGLEGKDGNAPKNISQEAAQRWLAGWNDGVAYRILGKEHKDQLDALLPSDTQTQPEPPKEPGTPLEKAIEEVGTTLRVDLAEFGPGAVLEEIELGDLMHDDASAAEVENAARVVIFSGDKERVLKNRDGGVLDPPFEATGEELAAQNARPSTIASKDPAKK